MNRIRAPCRKPDSEPIETALKNAERPPDDQWSRRRLGWERLLSLCGAMQQSLRAQFEFTVQGPCGIWGQGYAGFLFLTFHDGWLGFVRIATPYIANP